MKIDKDVLKILNESEYSMTDWQLKIEPSTEITTEIDYENFKSSIKEMLNSIGINALDLQMDGLIKYYEQDGIISILTDIWTKEQSGYDGRSVHKFVFENDTGIGIRKFGQTYQLLKTKRVGFYHILELSGVEVPDQIESFEIPLQIDQLKDRLVQLIKKTQQQISTEYPDVTTKRSRYGLITYKQENYSGLKFISRIPKWIIDFK